MAEIAKSRHPAETGAPHIDLDDNLPAGMARRGWPGYTTHKPPRPETITIFGNPHAKVSDDLNRTIEKVIEHRE